MAVVKTINIEYRGISTGLHDLLTDELSGIDLGGAAMLYFTDNQPTGLPGSLGLADFAACYDGSIRLYKAYVAQGSEGRAMPKDASPKFPQIHSVGLYVRKEHGLVLEAWLMLPEGLDQQGCKEWFQSVEELAHQYMKK